MDLRHVEPRETTVDIPAGRLDVLVWEPDRHPPVTTVLALHGFPETAWEWAPVAGELVAEGIRVIAPTQRGYTPGVRPTEVADYAIEHLATDAVAVADHLGLSRVHVLGHDWGACVGWWLAAHHADRLDSLTVVSIPHLAAFSEAVATDPEQQAGSAYFGLFRQEGKAEEVLLEDGAARLRSMFAGQVPDHLVERHLEVVGTRAGLTGALNWYRAMRNYDLPDVTVPTTLIWGEQDPAIARSGVEATASRMAGPYRFVPLPGQGHWVPEQSPGVVAREVLARVRGVGDDPAP